MSLFVCENCNNIDDLELVLAGTAVEPGTKLLCTACLPVGVAVGGLKAGTGKWHGFFPAKPYDPEYDLVLNRPTGLSVG